MIIYLIKNKLNNKIYIGQSTRTLEDRIKFYKADVCSYRAGRYKARSKIIRALVKYDFINFEFSKIDEATDQNDLDIKEKLWIKKFQATDDKVGYNIQLGGFGVGKHSEETKKIMSDKKKGKSPPNKGKPGKTPVNAKFTKDLANQIRDEYKNGIRSGKLAEKYSTSKTTIKKILNNTYYKQEGYVKPQQLWFVYLIQSSKDGSIYTGITVNVDARLKTHNDKRGARYTRSRAPFILLKQFECPDRSSASKLEYKIKKLSRQEKLELIAK